MSYADDHPGHRIETERQGSEWARELVAGVTEARVACDVPAIPGMSPDAFRREMTRRYHVFLVRHGSALGSLVALHRCGRLGDVAYNTLRERVLATLHATVKE